MVSVVGVQGSSTYAVPEVLVDALAETVWALPGLRVGLARLTASGRLQFLACSGPEHTPRLTGHTIDADAATVLLEALRCSDDVAFIEDVRVDRRTKAAAAGLEHLRCRAMLALAVRRSQTGAIAGIVMLDASTPRTWGQREHAALEQIAGIAGLTLDNVALTSELGAAEQDRNTLERRLDAFRAVTTSVVHEASLLSRGLSAELDRARAVLGPSAESLRRSGNVLLQHLEETLADALGAASGQTHAFSRVDVNRVVTSVLPVARTLLAPRVTIETELTSDLPPACANRTALSRLLLNLIVHACGPPNSGSLLITTRPAEQRVEVELRGSALTCDPSLAQLETPAQSTTVDAFGFGLWLVRCELLLHDARIELDRGADQIRLYFPTTRP